MALAAKSTILERLAIPGGALDGLHVPRQAFVIAAGREWRAILKCFV